ncbi:MAG TPA: DUF1524 domain-containing protein [Actinoallomurus sp.]|nr:DUF1524 domain-containing protein [Actinoallomurus sp.]
MRRAAMIVATLIGIASLVGPSTLAAADPPPPPPVSTARTELAALTVGTPHSMTGYSRDAFDIWAGQPDGCTTRQDVLARDGDGVVEGSDGCQPAFGSWYSAYDGTTVTVVAQATIDHVVPLADAWRTGADQWTPAQRKAFGNDLTDAQLIIASSASNSSKGDKDPSEWKPPNTAYWCTYGEQYVSVKYVFHLFVTSDEKSALGDLLDAC